MAAETFDGELDSPAEAKDQRHDEWGECINLIAKQQDRAAFTRLFRHFAPRMKAFALASSTLPATHADELVQEVMLKVWQKAGAFDDRKAVANTWIYTIARNCRADLYRRLQKFDTPLLADDLLHTLHGDDAFVVLHEKRSQDRIRKLIGELPIDQAQICAKVYMQGKSHAEVAAELGLPLGTVKSRVRLALQKLQIQIDQ